MKYLFQNVNGKIRMISFECFSTDGPVPTFAIHLTNVTTWKPNHRVAQTSGTKTNTIRFHHHYTDCAKKNPD